MPVFSVLVSLLVARTLTPTLAAYFLRPPKHRHDENEVKGIALSYQKILVWALKHRFVSIIIIILVFVGSIPLAALIPKGFVPKNDRDEFDLSPKLEAHEGDDRTRSREPAARAWPAFSFERRSRARSGARHRGSAGADDRRAERAALHARRCLGRDEQIWGSARL